MSRHPSHATAPIGIFDSGVGGLSVLREIRRTLPQENLIYVADSGHAPYGDQPSEFIEGRASAVVRFLLDAGAKAITVACNTATVVAVEKLRSWSPVPIVAIEPAIKPAAASTRSGVIAVLATSQTLASSSVARLCAQYGNNAKILLQPCPGWVELVERGELDSDAARTLVAKHLAPALTQGADTLVLGCTHYPFLQALLREQAGPDVTIIDPAAAVARELARRLDSLQLLNPGPQDGSAQFFSSGELAHAQQVMPLLWSGAMQVNPFPASES